MHQFICMFTVANIQLRFPFEPITSKDFLRCKWLILYIHSCKTVVNLFKNITNLFSPDYKIMYTFLVLFLFLSFLFLYQISRSLQWTPPLHTMNSAFLKTTEKQNAVRQSDHIFSIQTDLISGPRYYAKKVYLDAVTGKLNGRKGYGGSILQFHIKEWEEKDRIVHIGLDITVCPGVWNVLQLPVSGTTTIKLRSQALYPLK